MSIPGDPPSQPNQPHPYTAQPYQQPGPQQPNPYGAPVQGDGHGFGPPMAPPSPAAVGAGRGWLWALGGAVVASAVWAAAIFATGGTTGGGGSPDLAGYEFRKNICPETDLSAFKKKYPDEKSKPSSDAATHKALDAMWCTTSLAPSGTRYSSATLSVEMWLYKETDPAANFAALYESFDQRGGDENNFTVQRVAGIGDVAYLVVPDEPRKTGSSAYLAVRDGWMTYQMSWSNYVSSSDTGVREPELSEVEEMLKHDTKATLAKLKG